MIAPKRAGLAITLASLLALVASQFLVSGAAAAVSVAVGCTNGKGDVAGLVAQMKAANLRSPAKLTVLTLGKNCTYTLKSVAGWGQSGRSGLPVVDRHLVIDGRGSVITRGGSKLFRILTINATGNLTLNSLTISNGHATNGQPGVDGADSAGSAGAPGIDGGGIHNRGVLQLNRVTVTGNTAGDGGSGGSSTSSNGVKGADNPTGTGANGADALPATGGDGGAGGSGGGIYNAGQLTITHSTFSNNAAGKGGDGGDATGGRGGDGGQGTTGGSGGHGGNASGGKGGDGGGGGAIFNRASVSVADGTFQSNVAADAGLTGSAAGGRGGDAGGPHGNGGTGGNAYSFVGAGGPGGFLAVHAGTAMLDGGSASNNDGGNSGGGVTVTPGDAGTPGCEGFYSTGTGGITGALGGTGGVFVASGANVTFNDFVLSGNVNGSDEPSGPLGVTGGIGPACT